MASPLNTKRTNMDDTAIWIRRWSPRPEARSRIFCFPWAGGSAVAFRRWSIAFPPEVEVCAVEYPGRGSREQESALENVGLLSSAVEEAVAPLLDRPFAVVGFSLGALVAFEWLRALAATEGPAPVQFIPCARRAPHLPQRLPILHVLPEEDLLEQLQQRFGAIPEVLLRERELLAGFLVPLRADLAAVEDYVHKAGKPFTCPVLAIGGRRDLDVNEAELEGWAEHTRGHFGVTLLDAGHFFADDPALRVALLRAAKA